MNSGQQRASLWGESLTLHCPQERLVGHEEVEEEETLSTAEVEAESPANGCCLSEGQPAIRGCRRTLRCGNVTRASCLESALIYSAGQAYQRAPVFSGPERERGCGVWDLQFLKLRSACLFYFSFAFPGFPQVVKLTNNTILFFPSLIPPDLLFSPVTHFILGWVYLLLEPVGQPLEG